MIRPPFAVLLFVNVMLGSMTGTSIVLAPRLCWIPIAALVVWICVTYPSERSYERRAERRWRDTH